MELLLCCLVMVAILQTQENSKSCPSLYPSAIKHSTSCQRYVLQTISNDKLCKRVQGRQWRFQVTKGQRGQLPFGLDLEPPPNNLECLSDRTAQCCFLCLQGKKYGQYAVRIPCFRPTESRRVQYRQFVSTSDGMKSEEVTYEQLNPKENACESDASVYDRLREACFQHCNK